MRQSSKTRWIGTAVALMIVAALLAAAPASAHRDPADCSANSVGISFSVFRADGTTPIASNNVVGPGEEIRFQTTLSFLSGVGCGFGGGPDGQVTITTPDGTTHTVVAPGDVPLVNGADPSFVAPQQSYVVDEADVSGGSLKASTAFSNGISHTGGDSQFGAEDHDAASATAERSVNFDDTAEGVAVKVASDATPSFGTEVLWEVRKTVDVASHDLGAGESARSTYTVTLDRTGTGNTTYVVNGTITIDNPAASSNARIFAVGHRIAPDIQATVGCGVSFPFELGPGDTLTCRYHATLPDDATRTSTSTVSTTGNVAGNSTTAEVDFTGVEPSDLVHEAVTIDDTDDAGDAGPFTDDAQHTYPVTFRCGQDVGTHVNTATILETGQTASATVEVTCPADPTDPTDPDDPDDPTDPGDPSDSTDPTGPSDSVPGIGTAGVLAAVLAAVSVLALRRSRL